MKSLFLTISLLLITLTHTASANPCSAAGQTAAIDRCAQQNRDATEKALNDAYRSAKKRIDSEYQADPASAKALQQHLLEAQRGWLKYREHECKMEAFLAEEGSAASQTLINNCAAQLNIERNAQLINIPVQ